MQRKPLDFIGIGTSKAASTWIYKCLGEHPQVCKALKKEVRFFNNEHHFAKGEDWYYQYFPEEHNGRLLGEFSPTYIYTQETARRIKASFPKVKLIVVFRNPIEKTHSHYWYNKVGGRGSYVDLDSFEDFLVRVPDAPNNALHGAQLKRYLEVFPREQFHFVLYDDVRRDPENVMRDIYRFLNIDETFVAPSTHRGVNETGGSRIKYKRLFRFIFGTYRRLAKYPFLKKFIHRFNTLYWSNVLRNFGIRYDGEKIEKPPMKQETREQLRAFFADDTRLLGELIGRDVSHWV